MQLCNPIQGLAGYWILYFSFVSWEKHLVKLSFIMSGPFGQPVMPAWPALVIPFAFIAAAAAASALIMIPFCAC